MVTVLQHAMCTGQVLAFSRQTCGFIVIAFQAGIPANGMRAIPGTLMGEMGSHSPASDTRIISLGIRD